MGTYTKFILFILVLILGDNLGLNGILSFNKSFSSNYFCRFCKVLKSESHTMCTDNIAIKRTRENYLQDVTKQDTSKTGIIGDSCLNHIPSFHVVENFCVHVMHDIFEGVCHYDFCHIILYFTSKMKYFQLETLNSRKRYFNYGPSDIGNISGEITSNHLTNKHLKCQQVK